jgi:hypothetical protein
MQPSTNPDKMLTKKQYQQHTKDVSRAISRGTADKRLEEAREADRAERNAMPQLTTANADSAAGVAPLEKRMPRRPRPTIYTVTDPTLTVDEQAVMEAASIYFKRGVSVEEFCEALQGPQGAVVLDGLLCCYGPGQHKRVRAGSWIDTEVLGQDVTGRVGHGMVLEAAQAATPGGPMTREHLPIIDVRSQSRAQADWSLEILVKTLKKLFL